MPPAASDWISLEEAAEILSAANVRFRPATIGGWARAGKVQSIKLGGRRFVRRGEIKALVAAHWDESTGDLIVRAVIGWGGRGARGDTDRTANKLLGRLLNNILESSGALGLTAVERPGAAPGGPTVTCQHCFYPNVHPRAVYCPKCGMRMIHA